MGTSTPLTLINLFTTINIKVVFNFFIYSGMVSLGVSIAIKVTEGIIYVLTLKHKRKVEEIKELNIKMHDRLVDIDFDKKPEDFLRNQKRLRYLASRLKKYDKTIFEDVNKLIEILSSDNGESTDKKNLIEEIEKKVDKLWF